MLKFNGPGSEYFEPYVRDPNDDGSLLQEDVTFIRMDATTGFAMIPAGKYSFDVTVEFHATPPDTCANGLMQQTYRYSVNVQSTPMNSPWFVNGVFSQSKLWRPRFKADFEALT